MIYFNKYFLLFAVISILFSELFIPENTFSQEMEPRNYSSIPIHMNVAAVTYLYSTGDVVSDATSPIQNLDLNSNTVGLGFLRSFGVFGKLCKIQISVPYTFLGGTAKLNGKDTSGTRSGFSDSKVKFVLNFIGTPALLPKDFVKFKEEFVLGTSLVIALPTGQYYDEKLINLGSNRWGFKPEIGMSYNKGPFYFELFTGIWLFTDNNSFLKSKTLTQNPLFSMQVNLSYFFPSKIWIALNTTYVNGGETKVNGTLQNNFQKNFRGGLTLSVPVNMQNSFRLSASKGVYTRAGGDFTNFSLTYQYIWF